MYNVLSLYRACLFWLNQVWFCTIHLLTWNQKHLFYIKIKLDYQTDQITLGFGLICPNIFSLKIKYGDNRTLSWNSLRKNDSFSQNMTFFVFCIFLVWHTGVCQIISFTVNFDYFYCHGEHNCTKLCIRCKPRNRFETKTINLTRFV